MAMISLSAARRLKPSRTPTSTAMGMVTLKRLGSVKRKTLQHVCEGGAVAHHHLKDVRQVGHEENEGEERAADEGVGENLAEDVAGEDAHRQAL